MTAKKVTQKHLRLAYKHAKEHVLNELRSLFSDLISEEHHSIIITSDDVDLNEEVVGFLIDYERKLLRILKEDAFRKAAGRRQARLLMKLKRAK